MGKQTGPAASDSFNEICSIRIELLDTDPLIWREVEVPTSITLKVLHDVVQTVMGWFDSHLWELTIDGRRYAASGGNDWGSGPAADAMKVRLRDVLSPGQTRIDYLYDFGDSWEHRLTVTRIRPGEPGVSYPRYVGGARNGPPENCGGIPGFYQMLDVLADPRHPDHAQVSEWRSTTRSRSTKSPSASPSAASPSAVAPHGRGSPGSRREASRMPA